MAQERSPESDTPDFPLRGDLRRREQVDTRALPWSASPSPSVLRKRLHRVGPAESGQVTSLVRYEPGARFPVHDHTDGEEILVLSGVFSDQRGDHGPGSYLLSPEGHRHAPGSEPGCVLFVKLRQYAGAGRVYVEVDSDALAWQPAQRDGVEEKPLYSDPRFPDSSRLERWRPGARPGPQAHPGGAEVYVIEGALADPRGRYAAGSWLRLPPGDVFDAHSVSGARVFVKSGGVAGLRSA
jgi:anti-sigma factor ChrR (cupin superfamily)